MCRAGGRRCSGAGGRSTQNTRQAVSRAKRALRTAKTTGNPDQVTTARDRLAAARAAHQEVKNATTTRDTAGQCGDVTDRQDTTTKDTGMDDKDHDSRGDDHQDQPRHTGFTIHNTNIVSGNARVGSQHDVQGSASTSHFDDVADQVKRAAEQVKRARRDADRDSDQRGSVNVASGNDVVGQQVGFQFGTTRVHRTGRGEDSAEQRGDVTPRQESTWIGGTEVRGGVGNVVADATGPITVNNVRGRNHGIQTTAVNGGITINQPPRPGHRRDVTPPTTPDQPPPAEDGSQVFRTPGGTMRVGPDGHVEITHDGHTDFQGHVSGEVWINGRRVR